MRVRVVAAVVVCLVGSVWALNSGSLLRAEETATWAVVVTDAAGETLARVPLPQGEFAVSYRNSIYKTLAEERYVISDDGSFRLRLIAADQLAVLEEYYGVPGAPRRAAPSDRREWVVAPDPAHPLVLDRLSIAATDLGERTLHAPGANPVPLWALVEDDPTVVLHIEEPR